MLKVKLEGIYPSGFLVIFKIKSMQPFTESRYQINDRGDMVDEKVQ
jgi:hypothetical protein